ncbi:MULTISPECIES: hypothetical protein [unclassified Brenneria]|uniref:hypothetical protein n=1 Tax=unclassified Brenneria TaxID=2634434 RepID=UPI0018F0FD9C|nr:hypothetical protein [Brenneria sp. L3-3C-1]MBJ7222730.1 hypothetical protein [Brenneria sp. L3-3C-1]MEE3643973.1 hypothetical protein [Brenneria sp. L3_3C_1]
MNTTEKKTKQMPKGGRTGGATFPRISLSDALQYAKKLVSKTHISAQPQDLIFSGVLGAKGSLGEIKISSLRQYGFLTGDSKTGYSAKELAKKISAAPQEELIPLYQQAILLPKIFKKLFDTYHGDMVTKAKLKQRVSDLRVHPDQAELCVDLYVAGMLLAQLVTVDGESISHKSLVELNESDKQQQDKCEKNGELVEDLVADGGITEDRIDNTTNNTETISPNGNVEPSQQLQQDLSTPRAIFNVNISLDSSLDTEKLQKQLELLKRFGAI